MNMLSFNYILVLPEDITRRRQLMAKSRQYEERLATLEHRIRDFKSTVDGRGTQPTGRRKKVRPNQLEWLLAEWHDYELRLAILSPLLHEHQVNIGQLQRRLRREGHLTEQDENSWFMACAIIIDYVQTGGRNLEHGLGLPEVAAPRSSS